MHCARIGGGDQDLLCTWRSDVTSQNAWIFPCPLVFGCSVLFTISLAKPDQLVSCSHLYKMDDGFCFVIQLAKLCALCAVEFCFVRTLGPLTDGSLPKVFLPLLQQFFVRRRWIPLCDFPRTCDHIEVLVVLRYPDGLFWLLPCIFESAAFSSIDWSLFLISLAFWHQIQLRVTSVQIGCEYVIIKYEGILYYQQYHLAGGRCVGLTTLPPACADFLEIVGASTAWGS